MPLSDEARKHKAEYNKEYAKKNYKRIPLDVTEAKYQEILSASKHTGESVNGFIKKAIDMRLNNES